MMKTVLCICVCFVYTTAAALAQAPENWARFRGPNGQGISAATELPVQWGADNNIAWKTDIPGASWSSPIVWGNRIFVTTATDDGVNCHVIAIERTSGQILWDKTVFTQAAKQTMHPMNTAATPTPTTDGETVFAAFGGGGFAALDFEGNVRWVNTELDYYSQHGLGTSPILYGDLLIFAVNPSNREEPKLLGWQTPWDKSYLLALDKHTGKERWRGKRGMSKIGHSTPAIMQVNGKDQIISVAGNVIQGFDPADGRLIWTVKSEGEPCVPSPAIGDGLIYSSPVGSAPILAVRPDGEGDCTATHIAWQQRRNSPMMSSFLFVKPCLYTCTDNGSFSCLDAASGEFLWQLRPGSGALNPSPVYANGLIYILSERGTTTVLRPAADPKQPAEVIATNELGEQCRASMAVAGKQLIIRSANRLWCIGK